MDGSEVVAGIAGMGMLFLLVYLAVTIGVMILGVWIAYTIMWKAVRRGLYEYYNPPSMRPMQRANERQRGPRDW